MYLHTHRYNLHTYTSLEEEIALNFPLAATQRNTVSSGSSHHTVACIFPTETLSPANVMGVNLLSTDNDFDI